MNLHYHYAMYDMSRRGICTIIKVKCEFKLFITSYDIFLLYLICGEVMFVLASSVPVLDADIKPLALGQ